MPGGLLPLEHGWLDLATGALHRSTDIVRLSSMELALLSHLAGRAPGSVLKEELLTEVWGYRSGVRSSTVKTTVLRARRKLGATSTSSDNLHSDKGGSYRLRMSEREPPPRGEVTLLMVGVHAPRKRSHTVELDRLLDPHRADGNFTWFDQDDVRGLATSGDALELAVQLVSRAEDCPVRVALARANGAEPPHYAGAARDRVQALCEEAGDDRILLAERPEEVPAGWRLFSHGNGWMVCPAAATPPVQPAPPGPGQATWPWWHTPWVGREHALQALRARLGGPRRVITVHGPGGAGKTRLVVEAIQHRLDATFCHLASARSRSEVLAAVWSALTDDARFPPDSTVAIPRLLVDRGPALLILDNAEQVVDVVRHLLERWLAAAPEARWVVTSRVALGMAGEQVHPLGPMSEEDARALLAERVGATGAGLDRAPAAAIAQLLQRLDNLPLCIELVARRVPSLGIAAVLAQLDTGPAMLRQPGASGRHAALTETISWSWGLLNTEQRDVLTRCAVFAGSFTFQDAATVLADDPDGRLAVADTLASLVASALLKVEEGPVHRLHHYETIRDFVIGAAGSDASLPRDGHSAWVLAEVSRCLPETHGPGDVTAIRRLRTLAPDIHKAFDHVLGTDPARATTLLRAWAAVHWVAGAAGFRGAVERLIAVTTADHPACASYALRQRAQLRFVEGDRAGAYEDAHQCLVQAERGGGRQDGLDARFCRVALDVASHHPEANRGLSRLRADLGPADARLALDLSIRALTASLQDRRHPDRSAAELAVGLSLQRRVGARRALARLHHGAATLRERQGDKARAISHAETAATLAAELGDRELLAQISTKLGSLLCALGQEERGLAMHRRSVTLRERLGSGTVWSSRFNLASQLAESGRLDEAAAEFEAALRAAQAWDHPQGQAISHASRGWIRDLAGEPSAGLVDLRVGVDLLRQLPATGADAWFSALLAGALAGAGELREAVETLAYCQAACDGDTLPGARPALLLAYGRYHAARARGVDGAEHAVWARGILEALSRSGPPWAHRLLEAALHREP